jgi:beta-alanine--pyruvate transaminase
MAAGLVTLDVLREEDVLNNVKRISPTWEDGLHSLGNCSPPIKDIRNIGSMGAITFESIPNNLGQRAYTFQTNYLKNGFLVRVSGESIAMSPPLIANEQEIGQIIEILSNVLQA